MITTDVDYRLAEFIGGYVNGGFESLYTHKVRDYWKYSENHPGYNKPSLGDNGGEFALQQQTMSHVLSDSIQVGAPGWEAHAYTGRFFAPEPGFLAVDTDPHSYGATAYARMKNSIVAPSSQPLNFIYELKDLPGMLMQRFTPQLKSAGNYFLAEKFGWEPLLRDVRSFVFTQLNMQKRLEQLMRDNGKAVRRKIVLLDDVDAEGQTETTGYGNLNPVMLTQFYRSQPKCLDTWKRTRKVTASGRFRYWLPSGPGAVGWNGGMKARIFGFRPTPSVVYNAVPWTWLIDWFSNVGDVINNMDAGVADRFAADYFYVTMERKMTSKKECFGTFKTVHDETVSASASCTRTNRHYWRVHGNPFGFALPDLPLSAMQHAILGALGLSRISH